MNELFHYSLFLVIFLAFTYNKKQPPAFGAALAFFCFLLSFLGILFCHIPYNLSTILLTANNNLSIPLFYQISGTWSNHEGSILSWCRIPSFYGFLICYRCPPKIHHNVSELRILNFYLFLYYRRHSSRTKRKAVTQLFYTPFVLPIIIVVASYEYVLVINSELRGFYRPAFSRFTQKNKTREGTQTTHTTFTYLLLLMARDGKERASSIEEQRIFGLGIALFFSFFLSASPDPFIRNFFVRTEPLSELNPVPQDPLSAIHPPFIYAGEVASAMGFVLCRSKMMTGIVILHSPPIRKNTLTGTLLCSAGCVDESSLIRSELLFTLEFRRHVVGSMLSRIIYNNNRLCNRSLLMPWRRLVLVALDDGREQGKRSIFGLNTLNTLNTVVSVQDREFVKIWILICRWFLTVGILPGSWWAYHELGRGGWWFRDPVENASFMPRLLATALLHSVIIPLLNSWTSRMNLVTFLCCILGTFLIRSGLLASVHSFATDTLGIFLWWFFLIMTGISIIIFSQMKQQASVHITYKKEMILA